MDKHEAKRRGIRFVRKMLDTALEDAPDDVWDDPIKYFDRGRTLTLSLRLVRAINNAGFAMSETSARDRQSDGVRRRMELEDLFTTALVGAGHASLRKIRENDQARDALAEQLWETLHREHVVLRKLRRPA